MSAQSLKNRVLLVVGLTIAFSTIFSPLVKTSYAFSKKSHAFSNWPDAIPEWSDTRGELQTEPSGNIPPQKLPPLPIDAWVEVLNQVGHHMSPAAQVCRDTAQAAKKSTVSIAHSELLKTWQIYDAFEREFVTIPKGKLPDQTEVASFQAARYPVTQAIWQEIMGTLPEGVQPNCPNCPITHVRWEKADGSPAEVQTFLAKLNEKTAKLGCTYDLPTDRELHFIIRADVTGTNQDEYSAGVTRKNVNNYITHKFNSQGRIQPVGQKTRNAFGIELGNVSMMSKDQYVPHDPYDPSRGRSIRGSSWAGAVEYGLSESRFGTLDVGKGSGYVGFSLVRQCR